MGGAWAERRAGPGEARFLRRSGQVSHAGRETYLREDIACPRFAESRGPAGEIVRRGGDLAVVTVPSAGGMNSLLSVLECPQLERLVVLRSAAEAAAQVGGARGEARLAALQADRPRCQTFDDSHCLGVDALGRRLRKSLPPPHSAIQVSLVQRRSVRQALAAALWLAPLVDPIPVVVLATLEEVSAWRQGQEKSPLAGAKDSGKEPELAAFAERVEFGGSGVWLAEPGAYSRGLWSGCPEVARAFEAAQGEQEESAQTEDSLGGNPSKRFRAHLSEARLQRLLAEGSGVAGEVRAKRNDGCGTVVLEHGWGRDVFLPGPAEKNRAMPGDRVVVQVRPEAEWASEETVREAGLFDGPRTSRPGDEADGEGAKVPTGCVVGILDRAEHFVVAVLGEEDRKALEALKPPAPGESGSNQRRRVLCVPRNRAYPKCVLRTFRPWDLVGRVFVIRVGGWDQNSKCPAATFVRAVGEVGTLAGDTGAVLAECGIEPRDFGEDAIRCLPQEDWTIPTLEFNRRWDLRGAGELCICSIDPPGCTDVDDVLSVRRISDGRVEIGVHIADVSYFVNQGSALDAEARRRATTVYLVGQRFNMLPGRLSENLCSLVSGQDRLAFSVVWTLKEQSLEESAGDGGRPSVWIGRTVIKSQYQLSYGQAQDLLEGKRPVVEPAFGGPPGGKVSTHEAARIQSALKILSRLAAHLRAKRMAAGAVELDEPELSFVDSPENDSENAKAPTIKRRVATMALIAELMVAANAAAAEKCMEAAPRAALVRRHAPPPPNSPALRRLATLLVAEEATQGKVKEGAEIDRLMQELSGVGIARALDEFGRKSDPKLLSVARSYAVRAMAEAEYVTPVDPAGGVRHFGLALECYTHFTSPIRRYADLEVHRQLARILGTPAGSAPGLSQSKTATIAKECNERHRAAKKAQSNVQRLHLLYFLMGNPQVEQASVTEVSSSAFEVVCPRLQLGGSVQKEALEDAASTGAMSKNVRVLDSVWVRVSAIQEGMRPPELQLTLLDDSQQEVQAAKAKGRGSKSALEDDEFIDIGQALAQAGGVLAPIVDTPGGKAGTEQQKSACSNTSRALQDLLQAARGARTVQATVRPVPVPSVSASELNKQVLAQEYRRGRAWAKLVSGKSVQGTKLARCRQQRLQAREDALLQAKEVVRASGAEDLALATASLSLQDPSFP